MWLERSPSEELSNKIAKKSNDEKPDRPKTVLERLEPCEGKLSCTVLRGADHSNVVGLLDCFMNLFFERFLELLLKLNRTPLTPDRIRQALIGVHTITFVDKETQKEGLMPSTLSDDAEKIFTVLSISLNRSSISISQGCA